MLVSVMVELLHLFFWFIISENSVTSVSVLVYQGSLLHQSVARLFLPHPSQQCALMVLLGVCMLALLAGLPLQMVCLPRPLPRLQAQQTFPHHRSCHQNYHDRRHLQYPQDHRVFPLQSRPITRLTQSLLAQRLHLPSKLRFLRHFAVHAAKQLLSMLSRSLLAQKFSKTYNEPNGYYLNPCGFIRFERYCRKPINGMRP